ncbi:MAG: InlB B-repeat-containing protein [Clostridia bacterium]|nr:InlB B-repeat-containing protein [Clostridia bacterium]
MSKKHLLKAGIIGALCLTVSGGVIACTPAPESGGDTPPVKHEMVVTIADTELEVGQGEEIFVDVTNMDGEQISCVVSNPAVAFYDAQSRKIIGLSAGSADITFSLKTNPSIRKTITVTVIQTTEYEVKIGDGEAFAVVHGNKVQKPQDPASWQDEKTVYTFDCWVKDGSDIEWDFDTPVTGNLTLVPRWITSDRMYKVVVNGSEIFGKYGDRLVAPQAPSDYKTDTLEYTFEGWYVKDTDEKWNFAVDKINKDGIVIEPRFAQEVRYYTVTYVVDGETYKTDKYEFNAPLVHPQDPTKPSDSEYDYIFTEWVGDSASTVTSDMQFVASFESRLNYLAVSGKVVDEDGNAIVAQIYLDGANVGRSDGNGAYSFRVKIDGKEHYVTAIRDGYYEMGKRFTASLADPLFLDDIITAKSGVEGKGAELAYDKFGNVCDVDVEFLLNVNTSGNNAVGYTFRKGLSDGTLRFNLKFNGGCGTAEGKWADALINISGIITDTKGQKIGMGISASGNLNTSGTSLALAQPQNGNGSVGALLNRINNGETDVSYSFLYAKYNGEISFFAKSSLMSDYVYMGSYASDFLDGELDYGFSVTTDKSDAVLAFEASSLAYGSAEEARDIVTKIRGSKYKIVTYVERVDGTYEESEEIKQGFGNVEVLPEEKANFVINTDKSELAGVASKELVLKVYYDRVVHTITYIADGEIVDEQAVKHGAAPVVPFIKPKSGYTASWDKTIERAEKNETVTAVYTPSEKFAVNVKIQSKKINVLNTEYDAYEYSASTLDGIRIKITDASGNEVDATELIPGTYTVSAQYNGYTYEKNAVVLDSDANVVIEITDTVLGGAVGGFNSFVNPNKTYHFADSVSLSHHDYTYNASVVGDRYYLESEIFFDSKDNKPSNAMVGIMAAVRNEKLEGSGAGKLIVGVTQEGKLAYTYKGGWSYTPIEVADVKDKITYNGTKYSYKLGVYRNGADFALFVNGEYIDTITLGMFGKCGFGVGSVGNNDSNGKTYFTNYVYSFNDELLSSLQDYVAKGEVVVKMTTNSDHVLDKNGNKLYYQGEEIDNATAQKISLEIVDYSGNVIKNVVSADRTFTISLQPGTYKVKAKYAGVKATTVKESTISVYGQNKAFEYDISFTDIGGSYTLPSGKTVNSFGQDYVINEADSITLNYRTYAYIDGQVGDTAYIEGTFDKNTTGWYGFIMNSSEGAPTDGYKKIVFAILLDNLGGTHSLYVQHSTSHEWWKGTGKGSIENYISGNSATYKMGVLRVWDYYYVYINDTLFWQGQITALDVNGTALPANNKSGFGVFGGENVGRGARLVDDVKYTTDPIVASAILGKDVFKLTCDSEVTVISGGREVKNGGDIYEIESPEKLIRVNVPSGKEIINIDVKINGVAQKINYVSDGVYSFSAYSNGNISVDVEFGQTTNVTLNLGYKSAVAVKDGVEYALYDVADVVASNITVSLLNIYTGKVDTFALDSQHRSVSVESGLYQITYAYNGNVCVKTVHIDTENDNFEGEISKAYLGGAINFTNKTTGLSYTLTSFDKVSTGSASGSNWSLIDGQRNSVHMTNFTYVMQDKVVADQVYVEAKFDLTNQKFTGKIDEAFGGLLIAHGLDELSGNAGAGRNNSHKLMAGIYKESLVVNWDKEFGTVNTVVIANLEQLGLLGGDRSRVKLGVLRNKTNYYFYVNDVYVGKYIWEVQTDASGVGLIDIKSDVKIYEFNYSTRSEVISALTPEQKIKDIDIYFIAGQSNASGYTSYNQDIVMSLNDDYIYGFNNIWYTGNSRSGSATVANNRIRDISLMRAGYGAYTTTMGVEPGLAEALSVYYNHETGREAGFIKYAAGGTRLLNYFTGENGPEGNWVPPSYQAMLTSGVTSKTGGLYRNFIAQAEKSLADYKKLGYNPIIKGLYWMQGESDRGEPSEYMKAFKCFASDVRNDITRISGQDCSSMPIIIGEISRSFSSCSTSSMNSNANFIAMQNTIPQNVPNTYIVKSSVFDQNKYINGVATKVGSDQYHWNYKDHLKIGNMVGECILENVLKVKD